MFIVLHAAPADTVSKGLPQQELLSGHSSRGGTGAAAQCTEQRPGGALIPDAAGAGDHLFTLEEAVCKFEVPHWKSCNVPCDCWINSPEGFFSNCCAEHKAARPCPVSWLAAAEAGLLQASHLEKCPC